jgi:hypothetical protein
VKKYPSLFFGTQKFIYLGHKCLLLDHLELDESSQQRFGVELEYYPSNTRYLFYYSGSFLCISVLHSILHHHLYTYWIFCALNSPLWPDGSSMVCTDLSCLNACNAFRRYSSNCSFSIVIKNEISLFVLFYINLCLAGGKNQFITWSQTWNTCQAVLNASITVWWLAQLLQVRDPKNPAILTEKLRGFSQFLQANAEVML